MGAAPKAHRSARLCEDRRSPGFVRAGEGKLAALFKLRHPLVGASLLQ